MQLPVKPVAIVLWLLLRLQVAGVNPSYRALR